MSKGIKKGKIHLSKTRGTQKINITKDFTLIIAFLAILQFSLFGFLNVVY